MQPTVRNVDEHVTYLEFLPDEKLRDYIYCYWQLKTINKLTSQFNYRVVADGCIDIFFEPGNVKETFVMGFCRKYTVFPLEDGFNYIGIRFLPTMFPQIFKVDAGAISNKAEHLSLVVPKVCDFIAGNFTSVESVHQTKLLLDEFLSGWIRNVKFNNDGRLYEAIDIILKNYGTLNVETELQTGISPRQLRRLFHYYIGDSPKTFSKVVRFQNILKAKPSVQSLKKNKLFFDVGYFDQTHFIKEFKNFYGVTPVKAFGR